MGFGFKSFIAGVRLVPVSSTAVSVMGDLEVLSASGKLNYFNGTSASPILTEAHAATISNKILDASNTFLGSISTSFPDGTEALPGIPFAAQLNLGLYRPTLNVLGISIGGTEKARFDIDGLRIGRTSILTTGSEELTVYAEHTSAPAGTIRGVNSQVRANFATPFTTSSAGLRGEYYRQSSGTVTDTAPSAYSVFGINQIDLPAPSTYTAPFIAAYGMNMLNNVNGSTLAIAELYGLVVNTNSTTITGTKIGIGIGSLTGGTRNVDILSTSLPGSGNWFIYSGNTNPSYLAGSLRLGTINSISGFTENTSILNTISSPPASQSFGIFARTHVNTSSPVTNPVFNVISSTYRQSSGSVIDTAAFQSFHGVFEINLPAPNTYTNSSGFPNSVFRADPIVNVNGSTLAITDYAAFVFNVDSVVTGGRKQYIRLGGLSGGTNNQYIADSAATGDWFISQQSNTFPSTLLGNLRVGLTATDVAGSVEKVTVFLDQLAAPGSVSYGLVSDNLIRGNTANTFRHTGILARSNRLISSNTSESAPMLALEVQPLIGATPAATYTNTNLVAGILVNPVAPYGSATLALTYYAGLFFDTDSTSTGGKKSAIHFNPITSGTAHAYLTDNSTYTGNNFISQTTAADYSSFVGPVLINHLSGTGESGYIRLQEKDASPDAPTAGAECKIFFGAELFIIQYNDGGTVRYKYLDMSGTGVTWVHTTVSPI